MSKENTENKNNGIKKELTQEELAQLMGLSVPTNTTKTSTQELPLAKKITTRLNEVMTKTLCDEFPQYFYEIGETIVQHSNTNKDTKAKSSKVSGYALVLPKNSCEFKGKKERGFAIGVPTIYCKGLKTQDTLYVIKNGKTTFRSKEEVTQK